MLGDHPESERSKENGTLNRSEFFPLVDDFVDYVNVPLDKFSGPRKVLVSLDFLRSLIGVVAGELAFDINFYRDRYADLRSGVESGEIKDLKSHFVNHGFFERRQGCPRQTAPVDEKWYLAEYPDVAKGLLEGQVSNATSHYLATGRKEGRLPGPDVSETVAALIRAMHHKD
jgi:hypothetical protein